MEETIEIKFDLFIKKYGGGYMAQVKQVPQISVFSDSIKESKIKLFSALDSWIKVWGIPAKIIGDKNENN